MPYRVIDRGRSAVLKHHRSLVLLINGSADHFTMGKRHIDPKKFSKALGLRIRELRNERGWTLEACEEHGYTNWRHLQSIESGKDINVTTLVRIANLFGMHPSEILGGI